MYLRMLIIGRALIHQPQSNPEEVLDLVVPGVDAFLILLREVGVVHAHRIYCCLYYQSD